MIEDEIIIDDGVMGMKVKQLLEDNDITIPDAQEMLRAALSGGYSVEKLNNYVEVVSQLENAKEKKALSKTEQTKLSNNKQLLKFQQKVKGFLDILSTNSFTNDEAAEILLPFADPTFDTTFKELFGSDKHIDILISLLNSLLGFKGSETIISVDIIAGNLEVGNFSYKKGESGLKSEVDVLCTTQEGKTIAIEMQRAKQPYFLARMEYYMSKLIAGQLTEKDTNSHHKAIDKTYILVLAKENLFTGHHMLVEQFNKGTQTGTGENDKERQESAEVFLETIQRLDYEIDGKPVIWQTKQEFPDNKMYWKFFELSKFKEHNDSKNLTKDSDLKYQWLEFIIDCGSQLSEPDRHKLIKEGYNIMKTLQKDNLLKAKYWNEYHAQFEHELDIESQKQEAFNQGLEKGKLSVLKEKIESDIKREISKVKVGIYTKSSEEEIFKEVKFLKQKRANKEDLSEMLKDDSKENFKEHFDYINLHIKDSDTVIMGGLDIDYDVDFS